MKISGTDMTMIRGDTEVISVCTKRDNVLVPFVPGDTVYFSVKRYLNSSTYTIQKVITSFIDGYAYIEIDPLDTKTLAIGDYIYDIQVVYPPLTEEDIAVVTTIIWPSTFTIEQEVTEE